MPEHTACPPFVRAGPCANNALAHGGRREVNLMSKRRRRQDPFDDSGPERRERENREIKLLPGALGEKGEPLFPPWLVRRLFFIRIGKGYPDQLQETLDWGADPNWRTRKGTPALIRAVRTMSP